MCPVQLGREKGLTGFGISPVWREKGEQESEREKRKKRRSSTSFPKFHRISYHLHKYPL